jgi:hypothetical protein
VTEEGLTEGTLGDLLASRRRRWFVGRASEVELFRVALDPTEPQFSVLHIYGPGGIGKTTLLNFFADLAVDAGAKVVLLDGRDLSPSPQAVLDALGAFIEVPDGEAAIEDPSRRMVVLLDTYEQLTPIDDWFRTRLIPRLPAAGLTVIASRTPPNSAWRADPAWRDLLRVVSLRNFSPDEGRRYLHECGVDSALHDRFLEITHGHPLALSLLADVVSRGADVALDPLAPDLVATLLRGFVDAVPGSMDRHALEVCALARVTTEALLRDVLEIDDAHQTFRWLRDLSFIESGPEGVYPHDLARDLLDADLRWRDPESYRRVFRRVRAHIHERLKDSRGHEQQQVLFDEKFLFRRLPGIMSPLDWDTWGYFYPEPAQLKDREEILGLVEAREGNDSAAIAERWLDRQPEGFFVIRRHDGVLRGVVALIDLTRTSTEEIAADPGAKSAWDFAHRHASLRPNETVMQTRFVIDREAYQDPSPTLNATPIVTLQLYLRVPKLAWDFITLAEPEPWEQYFALADFPRAAGADFEVGGRRYGLFAHDFRRVPIDALLELWTERALAEDFMLPSPSDPPMLVLSQPEFDDAVRQALIDLLRPDLLARNPLLHTRLLRDRAGKDKQPNTAILEGLMHDAVETLRQNPRDDKLFRAIDRTYLHPAATQEAAAARLGLPFSTYRRHLTQGRARIVAWLWEREVYGGAGPN